MLGVIIMDIDIKQQIKEILLKENITMTDLVELLNNRKPNEDNKTTLVSLNNKLTRGSIKYSEILEIFDALDYDISLQKRFKADVQSSKSASSGYTTKSYTSGIAGATTGFLIGGIPGSIIGGLLGVSAEKTKSIIDSKEKKVLNDVDNFDWEQLQHRYELEEQFEYVLELLINSIISNADLEKLPIKIQSEIKAYQNTNDTPIGFKFVLVYRALYVIVAKQILNMELIDYLSNVRKMYNNGGITNIDNNDIREFIEKADYLMNTVFKID